MWVKEHVAATPQWHGADEVDGKPQYFPAGGIDILRSIPEGQPELSSMDFNPTPPLVIQGLKAAEPFYKSEQDRAWFQHVLDTQNAGVVAVRPGVFEDGLIGEEAVLWRDGGNGKVPHGTPQKVTLRVIESLPRDLWSLPDHVTQSRERTRDLFIPTASTDHSNVSNKPSRRKRKAAPADEQVKQKKQKTQREQKKKTEKKKKEKAQIHVPDDESDNEPLLPAEPSQRKPPVETEQVALPVPAEEPYDPLPLFDPDTMQLKKGELALVTGIEGEDELYHLAEVQADWPVSWDRKDEVHICYWGYRKDYGYGRSWQRHATDKEKIQASRPRGHKQFPLQIPATQVILAGVKLSESRELSRQVRGTADSAMQEGD
jgi:hypothetical protein